MKGSAGRPTLAVLVGFFAVLALAGSAAAVVDSPAAHWKFDETSGSTAADEIGSLDGTIHGASPAVGGFDGGAFHFDGSDDVSIPNASSLRSPEMVASVWVRGDPNSAPTPGQVILDNGNVLCGGNGYALVATATWAKLVFRDAQANIGIVNIQPSPSIQLPTIWDGAWHHVAIGSSYHYGFVYLFIDGWFVATTNNQPSDLSDGIGYGASPSFPYTIGDDDQDCGPGFVGDIDDVRVYSHLIDRADLAGLEPEVQTTLEITSVQPGAVRTDANIGDWYGIDVTLLPAPAIPGSFFVYVTGDDGIERQAGGSELSLGTLSADGHYDLGYQAEYGGDSSVRVAYVPEIPGLPSEDAHPVQIAKAESFTYVNFDSIDLDADPIRVGVTVSPTARVPATGTVELWDVTGTPVLLGQAALANGPGSWLGGAVFDLAGRPTGQYKLKAKYFGSAANLPSESVPSNLDVLPGLEPGDVVINGGDATTNDPIVEVSAPAPGAIGLIVTTDPTDVEKQVQLQYTDPFETSLTQPWFGDDADGVRTLWVKWEDAKGYWTDWSSDTIVLARPPAGTITINNGAGYTTDRFVNLKVPIADSSSVKYIELSNDGHTWSYTNYTPSIGWQLTSGSGLKSVRARWVMNDFTRSMSVGDSIVFDNTAPSVTGPIRGFAVDEQVSDGKVPVRLSWSGSDPASGISRYELSRSMDGGGFTTIASSLAAASSIRRLEAGHDYRFRVRAFDKAGNHSSWAYGSTFHVSPTQDSSSRIHYTASWKPDDPQGCWGGSTRRSTTAGASATFIFTGRTLAWIAPVGPTRGSAKVYVNGSLVATVSLYSASTSARQVVFAKSWSTSASRTVVIKVVGTAGHSRVDIDALVWGT